jgi:hypothetical protein
MNSIPKDQYGYWPIFRQEDTPRSKVTKKKLYSHLLVIYSTWLFFKLLIFSLKLNLKQKKEYETRIH